jgi:hypothetical protein
MNKCVTDKMSASDFKVALDKLAVTGDSKPDYADIRRALERAIKACSGDVELTKRINDLLGSLPEEPKKDSKKK